LIGVVGSGINLAVIGTADAFFAAGPRMANPAAPTADALKKFLLLSKDFLLMVFPPLKKNGKVNEYLSPIELFSNEDNL
jgi:hypothetical protein